MVDLGGYVIILVETKDKRVKLYGSPADKAELEVADEILEINGKPLNNCSHPEVITHIHNCIKSRTICLRVKRRTGNKLAEELAENSNVQDAFVIAVEQQARERLERLSALRKIKPVDMTQLSQELCEEQKTDKENPIYSTPVSQIGSSHNVKAVVESEARRSRQKSGGALTDEELELNQRINRSRDPSLDQSRASYRSRDQGGSSCRSRDSSRDLARSRDSSRDLARSRDSSKDSLRSKDSCLSRDSPCRSRDCRNNLDRFSRHPSKETILSKDSTVDYEKSKVPNRDVSLAKSMEVRREHCPRRNATFCSKSKERFRPSGGEGRERGLQSGLNKSEPSLIDSGGGDDGRIPERLQGPGKSSILEHKNSSSPLLNPESSKTQQNCDKIVHPGKPSSVALPDTKHGCEHPALATPPVPSTPQATPSTQSKPQAQAGAPNLDKTLSQDTQPLRSKNDTGEKTSRKSQSGASENCTNKENKENQEVSAGPVEGKEVLIGGDTEENRSARGSIRLRHQVKTFSEPRDGDVSKAEKKEKPSLKPTYSLKTVLDVEDMARCLTRLNQALSASPAAKVNGQPSKPAGDNPSDDDVERKAQVEATNTEDDKSTPDGKGVKLDDKTLVALQGLSGLVDDPMFSRLMSVHNTIQLVQCFRCPPPPLCTDARDLVQECMNSLQGSHLPEAAEILDILNQLEFEALFYSHDKLADLQGGMPWARCLAEMWSRDRPGSATPDNNTRVVRITKHNEPLGATVRNEGEKVVIGRVVKGGAAERSGNLQPGDEVLEVNGLRLKGKSVHDICSTLCQMSGTLTFVIIPGNQTPQEEESQPVYHYRAHFSYSPEDDLYIPCHELGISFQRGDILHVINKDDPHWWQAYRDGEWTQTLAGLIPSLALQQHRLALHRQKKDQEAREQSTSPARKKTTSASLLCAKKAPKRKNNCLAPFKRDIAPYEEMSLYYPQANQRRPLILVGPPSIGRHELRQRLLDDTSKFAAPVPHTTRGKEEGELHGVDYSFVSRVEFETMVEEGRFLEHGEYDKQMYGTTTTAIKQILNSGKICVLNIQPTSLPAFHDSDLKPYVIFLTPPSPHVSRHLKLKAGEPFKEDEYRELVIIAHNMEDNFGHFFDSVIPFEDVDFVLKQVMYEISLLEKEPQWVPAKWVQ